MQNCKIIDDDVDLERRKKRSEEFSVRFSRNHLYQIGRLIQDLKISRSTFETVNKTSSLFNAILQALSAYSKSMSNFMYNKAPEKLLGKFFFIQLKFTYIIFFLSFGGFHSQWISCMHRKESI